MSSCFPIFNNFNFFAMSGYRMVSYCHFILHFTDYVKDSHLLIWFLILVFPYFWITCSHFLRLVLLSHLHVVVLVVFPILCLQGFCIFCTLSLLRFQIHSASFWFISSHYGVLIKVKFIEILYGLHFCFTFKNDFPTPSS